MLRKNFLPAFSKPVFIDDMGFKANKNCCIFTKLNRVLRVHPTKPPFFWEKTYGNGEGSLKRSPTQTISTNKTIMCLNSMDDWGSARATYSGGHW